MKDITQKKPNIIIRFLKWLFPWKGDGIFECIRKIIFLIALIVLIGTLSYFGNYLYQRYRSDRIANKISDIYDGNLDLNLGNDKLPLPEGYNEKFDGLYQINQDIKGFIKVDGTTISYPVVQGSDNDYYLRRNIYKEYDINGVPFLDYRNEITKDNQSDNLIIYGHHMNFDGVFGPFIHYNKLDFYKEHPIINFDSVYKDMKFKIVGGFYAATSEKEEGGPIFDYQNYINLSNKKTYNEFINQVKTRSVVDTGVDVQQGDKFITISTCANEFHDARFVVVARMVRDNEDENPDLSKAQYNKNVKYPQAYRK